MLCAVGVGGLESQRGLMGEQSPAEQQREWDKGPSREVLFTSFPGQLSEQGA